jgi:hypothetical protein
LAIKEFQTVSGLESFKVHGFFSLFFALLQRNRCEVCRGVSSDRYGGFCTDFKLGFFVSGHFLFPPIWGTKADAKWLNKACGLWMWLESGIGLFFGLVWGGWRFYGLVWVW